MRLGFRGLGVRVKEYTLYTIGRGLSISDLRYIP